MEDLACFQLCKSFGGTKALIDVTLRFPSTRIIAIIGPNGAGKSTLINVITGFIKADSGECSLGQKTLTGLRPHQIAHSGIARTFQDLRLIQKLSVCENVMLAFSRQLGENPWNAVFRPKVIKQQKALRVEAERLLHMVGLEECKRQLAGALSYGQQKLLTLTACIATGAQVLIFDEPVSGVHPEMSDRILSQLRELQQIGKSIVFIEHDLAAVRAIADLVIVMDAGKVIATGAAGDILNRAEILRAYVG